MRNSRAVRFKFARQIRGNFPPVFPTQEAWVPSDMFPWHFSTTKRH